ncbi:hypothetical protein M409DRAFT_69319 [Zasmidium cellare ATCC 36951]|uniref:Uncharacterized protein n=1 Tax=Zasmidium cellare ATCC 36951 TaxID=1080233 RepID=A0A6A6C597_ZASCE|nr:uncharacterized protein M409DRAFT_69319 [Zasmidium cellare ATCC 36951]KAF2162093.1 hypothetical protein M409DRAFT_69319 [Zasmidium cellare ATCC 36951]
MQSYQSRDSSFTHLHLHAAHHADLLADFTRIKLPAEEINVAAQHQPINPDDEDDVVPDQHAAFGIQRAQNKAREPAWRDLGLERLMSEGPPKKEGQASAGARWVGSASQVLR